MGPFLSIIIGIDTIASSFFGQWYQTTDLAHYLDNCSAYTVYETETTGEWNLSNQLVFSISGNSFRQNKYHLNGMRMDSRTMPGDMMLHTQMDRTSLALDYHDGELFFEDDSVQAQTIRLTGNVGNLGGISPGTRQLINLFHSSAEERTLDNRPMTFRPHAVGAGTVDATFAIGPYYQHAYAYYAKRNLPAFDHSGISGFYAADNFRAQLDGELPYNLRYFAVVQGRSDYGSEFYLNRNELASQLAGQAGLYYTHCFSDSGRLVAGLSYEINALRHDSLSFARNVYDQDGEAFDPWYVDGRLHSVNMSLQYDRPLLSWLSVHAEAYNSLLHFKPVTTSWTNDLYYRSFADAAPTDLYTYHWKSAPFTSGILENEAMVIGEWQPAKGLSLYAHVGVSLDGIILGNRRTVISPNILAKFALGYEPVWWFRFGLSVSHHRMSYTWNEVQYLSADCMNGEARYADNTLLATTGGAYRTPDKTLWRKQPSYAVLDLPITFTFGKSRAHEIALINSLRKYYNQWFTSFTDGVDANMEKQGDFYFMKEGRKDYTVTTQPLDLMSSRVGGRTPYYMSNTVQYTYRGRKWFVLASWQSYLMAGISTLGNGPLHNTIGSLSESSANPNTYYVQEEKEAGLLYPANCRLDQDKSFILRLQVTYNACKYFSIGFNGKFKDGQPFSTYRSTVYTTPAGHPQAAIYYMDAKGINMHNQWFGKREDAFFNFELRATGRWWVNDIPMSLEVMAYNLYDFGTALTEYTFDAEFAKGRQTMSMCIPRGLLFTLRVGIEKERQ